MAMVSLMGVSFNRGSTVYIYIYIYIYIYCAYRQICHLSCYSHVRMYMYIPCLHYLVPICKSDVPYAYKISWDFIFANFVNQRDSVKLEMRKFVCIRYKFAAASCHS